MIQVEPDLPNLLCDLNDEEDGFYSYHKEESNAYFSDCELPGAAATGFVNGMVGAGGGGGAHDQVLSPDNTRNKTAVKGEVFDYNKMLQSRQNPPQGKGFIEKSPAKNSQATD